MNQIVKNSNQSLSEQIFNIQLLDNLDIENLKNSCDFILGTYQTVPMFRPLAIKIFGVLNDKEFPTTDLKYNQCKIEAEVHANELIRELHDLEMQKLHLQKAEYLLTTVIQNKYETSNDDISKKEIEFDMKEQKIIISKKKFEYKQLEKKIKYRIMEVHEWKEISEQLSKNVNFKNQNYNDLMFDLFINDYTNKLNDNALPEDKKLFIKSQLSLLNTIKSESSQQKEIKIQ